MRIAFFGTPSFAVKTLEALAREHEVVLVVAQPDKPAGRGMKMHAPEVVVKGRELGLPVVQPPKIRDAQFLDSLRALAPDLGVVVAYGKILPAALLQIPKLGFVNVHGSILPRWRGAAPIQRAIEAGDTVTGVTIMQVDEELDHGPMFAIEETEIGPDERAPSVAARLSRIGAEALVRVIASMPEPLPQDHARATYAPKIAKSEGAVAWSDRAKTIYDKFRAFDPWPGVFVGELKLTELARAEGSGEPGTILSIDERGVVVACGEGALRLVTVQRPGKPRVRAVEFARGMRWRAGARV